MCGRFTLTDLDWLSNFFGMQFFSDEPFVPRYNVAPTEEIPVVLNVAGNLVLQWMTWGFQPGWLKPDAKRRPPINARAETLMERSMFRDSLARNRCVIPASGFYEWRAIPGAKAKQPMYIRLTGARPLVFGGLYTERRDAATGGLLPSCAIITTAPNELMATIHDRMPAILDHDDAFAWLDPDRVDPLDVLPVLRPYPAEQMEAFAVSSQVSSVRNDGPDLVRPVGDAG
jgi:putative SOS response-associated peptidase YedK